MPLGIEIKIIVAGWIIYSATILFGDKMKSILSILAVTFSLLFVSGCSDETQRDSSRAEKPEIGVEGESKPLIKVNGRALNSERLKKMVELRVKLESMRKRKLRKDAIDKIKKRAASEAIPFFVQSTLYASYLSTKGMSVDKGAVEKYNANMARMCKVKDFKDLRSKLSLEETKILDEFVLGTLTIEKAKNHIISQSFINVSTAEVDKVLSRIDRANIVAAATNRLVFAHATNVWKEISSKKITFEEAVTDHSEDEVVSEGGEWGFFGKDMLRGEDALLGFLEKAKQGDVSAPIECDNGVCIIKVIALPSAEDSNYRLARVFFRLAEEYEIPQRSEVEAGLRKKAESKAIAAEFEKLVKSSLIEDNTKAKNRKFRSRKR